MNKISEVYMRNSFYQAWFFLTAIVLFFCSSAFASELPNKLELLKLLKDRNYNRLEAILVNYQTDYEKDFDYQKEDVVDYAFLVFDTSDPSFEKNLNEWVNKMPKSYAALMARGMYYYNIGWLSRGSKYIDKTMITQIKEMEKFFAKAKDDIHAALQINPKIVVGYGYLINLGMALGEREFIDNTLNTALKINPHSFVVRRYYIFSLIPKWGGSIEEMKQFANESQRYIAKNPILKILRGYIPYAEANILCPSDDNVCYIKKYNEALAYGDHFLFLRDRGEIFYEMKQYDNAITDFNRSLELRPFQSKALKDKAKTYYRLNKIDEALREINLAIELDRLEPFQLIERAKIYRKLRRNEEAEKDYKDAIVYGKYYGYVWRERAEHWYYDLKNYKWANDDLRMATSLNPENVRGWYLLGLALYRLNDDKAYEPFEKYLELCNARKTSVCDVDKTSWAKKYVACKKGKGPC
jgi:tetratricopeptide (TPR) repeat protein